jgi:hypothetical protein
MTSRRDPDALDAHGNAYRGEPLAEKAARLRREQGLPPEPEPHRCPPRPCYWHEEPEGGGRYLIPGCLTRINNPDIDGCDCPTLTDQLAAVREELATLRRHHTGLQRWHDAITAAVHAHPDSVQIMHAASKRAGL